MCRWCLLLQLTLSKARRGYLPQEHNRQYKHQQPHFGLWFDGQSEEQAAQSEQAVCLLVRSAELAVLKALGMGIMTDQQMTRAWHSSEGHPERPYGRHCR
jgi:hypothetical protein